MSDSQTAGAIRPFTIAIPDEAISDLHRRLDTTRWPDQVGPDWEYGTPVGYLRELCRSWRHDYDWRVWEARLNELPQFIAAYPELDLHFIHLRSSQPQARPLLMTHGWPGSFIEFRRVARMLTEPQEHGGRAEDAFHLVCPSIPGFAFSGAPREPGFETRATSRIFLRLMADLGYERFFVQGGDLGAGIALKIARIGQQRVRSAHLNMALVFAPAEEPMRGVSPEEQERIVPGLDRDGTGYAAIQSTRPQSLGYGLTDSPAGLAGWIVEKFHAWSDHTGDHEQAISREEILTNISIYWFTGCATSAARYYYESAHTPPPEHPDPPTIPAPISFALFPADIMHPPEVWARRQFNVARWTKMPRGGHFAALEQPDLLVEDIRASFRGLD